MCKRNHCATCALFELCDQYGNGYCRHYDFVAHAENPTCENYKKAMKKKVDEIKSEMGFEKQSPRCDNCKHIKGDISAWNPKKLINKRCNIGGFAVRPMNWCKRYERK